MSAGARPSSTGLARSRPGILVAEDDGIVAEDIRQTLERAGYRAVAVVDSGEAAIVAAERLAPAVALLDIRLAGAMDGVEAARVVRERYGVPVVFLTSCTDDGTRLRAQAARPSGYVRKPFDEGDLRGAIEAALVGREAEPGNGFGGSPWPVRSTG